MKLVLIPTQKTDCSSIKSSSFSRSPSHLRLLFQARSPTSASCARRRSAKARTWSHTCASTPATSPSRAVSATRRSRGRWTCGVTATHSTRKQRPPLRCRRRTAIGTTTVRSPHLLPRLLPIELSYLVLFVPTRVGVVVNELLTYIYFCKFRCSTSVIWTYF